MKKQDMSRQQLVDEVIDVIKDNLRMVDEAALEELLMSTPTEILIGFLPEEEQDNELKKYQIDSLRHWEKTFLEGGVDDEHSVFIAGVLAAERRNLERRIEPCNKEQDQ